MHTRGWAKRVGVPAVTATLVMGLATGCTPSNGDDASGEVVITCASCQQGEDLFLQYNYDAAQRFNEEFEGKYRVESLSNQNAGSGPERLAYYQRLALADDLPDVFLLDKQEATVLSESAELYDFADALDAAPEWRDSYYPESLEASLIGDRQLALPQTRDVVGIYANDQILADAGVTSFPETWDELEDVCDAVAAQGQTCLAMDGNWVTLLMWANLIGTHPDGVDVLTESIAGDGWASDPAVVESTERLLSWQQRGFVNTDSLSGDYANAATVYQTGQAAMIANGPWMLGDIRSDSSAAGLGDVTSYNASPGWTADARGVVSITGGAWVSGSQDEAKQQAAAAFLQFLVSEDQAFEMTLATGSYPPVDVTPTAEQSAQLDPLVADLVEQSASLPLHYPNATANAPATFSTAWLNLWPAYVQGELTTTDFLDRLEHDSAAG